jgi:oligopeptide/dipeptide ABC transporter ATP-binding protein
VISHDLSVVRYLADRIGVMYLGKLVEIGTGEDIYQRAAHPYTAGLLEAIPLPNPAIAREKAKTPPVRGELPSPLNPPSGCRFRTRCPLAQDKCAAEVPLLRSFGGEHMAACHFPLQKPTDPDEAASVPDTSGVGVAGVGATETASAQLGVGATADGSADSGGDAASAEGATDQPG